MNTSLAAAITLAVCVGNANAYEIGTHGAITAIAYQHSTLNAAKANSIVPVLGFDRLSDQTPFRDVSLISPPLTLDAYFDDLPTAGPDTLPPIFLTHNRTPELQDRHVLSELERIGVITSPSNSFELDQVKVDGWLVRGAIREDDNDALISGVWFSLDDRIADPYGPLLRAGRHFYDPANDRPYTFINQCATYGCVKSPPWALGTTDPFHPATDTEDTARRNHFTWKDARNNYWWALTEERKASTQATAAERTASSHERSFRWATTVTTLGHVIHLLQDAAQPQHTRNDAHAPPRAVPSDSHDEGQADAAYEAYTDNRLFGAYSGGIGGNPLTYMDEGPPSAAQLPPVVFGNYPNVAFSTPVKYFTTTGIDTTAVPCGSGSPTSSVLCARRGMADYSNRGFFTAGTVPGMRECASPGPGGTSCTSYQANTMYPMPEEAFNANDWQLVSIASGLLVNGRPATMTEVARTVPDNIAAGYDGALLAPYGGKVPLLTQSIWKNMFDLLAPADRVGVDLSIRYNNMRYDADVLIPRAVGYSAGMIDFFFRGRLKVDAPQDGLFSFADQGMQHTVDSTTFYPYCSNTVAAPVSGEPAVCTAGGIFGFTKLRLKVRNDTPAITESGSTAAAIAQNLSTTIASPGPTDPRLVAIVRYHRNLCYVQSMQGERVVDYTGAVTTPTCPGGNRTDYQEISVSAPLAVTAANLNGSTSTPVAFDFSADPVPINATDVIVQVAYRGPLGDETDGIALGTIDVREPSYLTVWNNSDHAGCNGAWTTGNTAGCDYMSGGTALRPINTTRLCIGSQLLYTRFDTGGYPDITLGNYVRVAALLDDQPHATLGPMALT